MMRPHHERTILDIPDDLHRIATSLARHTKRSLGETVAELMRRGLEAPPATYRTAEPQASTGSTR